MRRFKVLLVDDSPNVLSSLERSLKYKGYDIYTAESANAAFEILQVEAIDLIVTDEKMVNKLCC